MKPYGCHNRPAMTAETYPAQDGHVYLDDETRAQRVTQIKHVMTTECQYSKQVNDLRCADCRWNQWRE